MDADKKAGGLHYSWVILAVCTLAVFCSLGLGRFGYTMILPSMQKSLDLSNSETGAIATGNFIGYLALALVGGFLATRFKPRRVIVASLMTVGVTLILTALCGLLVL